jgi:hypothetical protein
MAPVVICPEPFSRISSALPVTCGGQNSDSARDSSHRPTPFGDPGFSFLLLSFYFIIGILTEHAANDILSYMQLRRCASGLKYNLVLVDPASMHSGAQEI